MRTSGLSVGPAAGTRQASAGTLLLMAFLAGCGDVTADKETGDAGGGRDTGPGRGGNPGGQAGTGGNAGGPGPGGGPGGSGGGGGAGGNDGSMADAGGGGPMTDAGGGGPGGAGGGAGPDAGGGQDQRPDSGPGAGGEGCTADCRMDCKDPASWPVGWVQFENRVIELMNERRAAGGRCGGSAKAPSGPLQPSAQLRQAARCHAMDMAKNRYLSHTGRDGSSPAGRARAAGYTATYIGENIANGQATPEAVMQAWMSSTGHCTNILNATANDTGVGYVFEPANSLKHVWAEVFGRR